ncbi:hypothetical protein RRG08_039419 [Elysia crispata]|uniref:WW domain-containing protein n=1 Tax=Elysia crispata TaxID=231223 RepID=A0AAE1AAP7_9GAST|nr:hypothetical protein RRG08_039419 [Elysia crispata]
MSAGLPPDWVCLVSKSRKGKKYFYNAQTGISTWTRPKHQVSSESVGDHSTSYGHTNNRKRKNRTNSAEISSIQPKKKIYASSDSTTAIALEVLQKKAHQYRRSSTAGSVSAECNGSSLSEGNHTYDKNALSGIQDRSDEKGLAFAKAAAHESVEVACSKVTTHNRSCPSKKNENGKKAETDHSKLFFPSKNIESNTVNVKNYEITSKCQTNGSLESVTKSKGFKPKMSTVQFAPEKLQPLPNSHVISADKSSGYITTITGGANQKVKAKKKSRKKRQESTRSDNAVKNTSTALEIAFGLQPLVETSVKSESQKLSPDLHKKIYLDNGHFKNSYNLFSSSQTAYSASESLGNPQGDKKLPQQLSELEVPVLTEQKRSTESGAVSQKMKSIKTILCFSHNVSMTSNTPVAHWASVSKETLKTAPSTEYTTRKDELAKEHYFDVGLISEDLIKSCIQKNKLSETSTQNMYARTKSPQCQSMENCQKIIPNQGLVKCAEEDSAFAINKYNIKQIDSESIKMNQASLDDTRAKKTPMNTTRQTNSFDTNHIPATVIKRDSTGSHLGTNMTSFTTPESYGVNCPSILLDNATLIPKFSTADKFQGFNASNCQLARNADSPTNIPYSFQDADLDIYTSIDLGASLTDAARVIEDMDVDSDGTDATIQALMLVIDTNVLIDSLGFLAKLINTSVPGYGTPTFVLPWVVIQELDYLKVARKTLNTSRVQHDAVKAVRFIHTHLMAKNAHVKGQTPQEV